MPRMKKTISSLWISRINVGNLYCYEYEARDSVDSNCIIVIRWSIEVNYRLHMNFINEQTWQNRFSSVTKLMRSNVVLIVNTNDTVTPPSLHTMTDPLHVRVKWWKILIIHTEIIVLIMASAFLRKNNRSQPRFESIRIVLSITMSELSETDRFLARKVNRKWQTVKAKERAKALATITTSVDFLISS